MVLDINEEKIHLVLKESITVDKLPSKVPENNARYHLFRFKHSHEGELVDAVCKLYFHLHLVCFLMVFPLFSVFIYSMPGHNCTIKERMLYSSCKSPFIDTINSWEVSIDKRVSFICCSLINMIITKKF